MENLLPHWDPIRLLTDQQAVKQKKSHRVRIRSSSSSEFPAPPLSQSPAMQTTTCIILSGPLQLQLVQPQHYSPLPPQAPPPPPAAAAAAAATAATAPGVRPQGRWLPVSSGWSSASPLPGHASLHPTSPPDAQAIIGGAEALPLGLVRDEGGTRGQRDGGDGGDDGGRKGEGKQGERQRERRRADGGAAGAAEHVSRGGSCGAASRRARLRGPSSHRPQMRGGAAELLLERIARMKFSVREGCHGKGHVF
eukprot:768509-Hanusia_phi.AAC.5